jgi:hypothetical protein
MARSDDGSVILPLFKSLEVPRPRDVVFRLFTERLAEWWPLSTHSVGRGLAATVIFEPWLGGRVYERWANDIEHTWGTVVQWRPPEFFSMTWHPGRGSETAQTLEVTFHSTGRNTRIELVQRDWERYGDGADVERGNYENGWPAVLAAFQGRCGSDPTG